MEVRADLARLDEILQQTVTVIKESQYQINSIADDARAEKARLTRELEKVREETLAIIDKVDAARQEEQRSRLYLMQVSRDFRRYNEEEIRQAYGRARDIQVRLIVLTEKEKNLRAKRDELERALRSVSQLLSRAETLSTQVGVALEYLSGNLKELSQTLDTIQEKREVAIRIIQAQEHERRRVARDLHDGLAQQLAAAILGLEVAQRVLENDVQRAKRELISVEQIIRGGLREAREVIFNLRPLSMDNIGLQAALSKLISRIKEQTGADILLSVHGEERKMDSTSLTCVFRIIQEALNNAIKHANATEIKVRLEFAPDFLAVQVIDNGCGFDFLSEETWTSNGEHLGLIGMKERAELIGATLKIDSRPGSGTRVFLHLAKDNGSEVSN